MVEAARDRTGRSRRGDAEGERGDASFCRRPPEVQLRLPMHPIPHGLKQRSGRPLLVAHVPLAAEGRGEIQPEMFP